MGRWEWIILEIGFLGLLIAELISVRRSIHKARGRKPLPPPGDAER